MKMADECLDLTFLKEIRVVLLEAAKCHEGRRYITNQLLGNKGTKRVPGMVRVMCLRARDTQRGPGR